MMSVRLDLQTLRPNTKGRRCFDNCVGVLVIRVLVFTVFCIVSFMYVHSYLLLV